MYRRPVPVDDILEKPAAEVVALPAVEQGLQRPVHGIQQFGAPGPDRHAAPRGSGFGIERDIQAVEFQPFVRQQKGITGQIIDEQHIDAALPQAPDELLHTAGDDVGLRPEAPGPLHQHGALIDTDAGPRLFRTAPAGTPDAHGPGVVVRGTVEQPFLLRLQALGEDQVKTAVPEALHQVRLRGERPDAGAPQTSAQGIRQLVFESPPLPVLVDIRQRRILIAEADAQVPA